MATKKREHRAVPFHKIVKLWGENKTYLQIGKAIDRLAKKGDITKPTRAIVSRMLTVGFKDENGKLIKLKPRQGMRAIGVGKLVNKGSKPVKVAKTIKPKVAKLKTAKVTKGAAIVIALDATGKFIKVELGNTKRMAKVEQALPQLIAVVDSLGYQITAKPIVAEVAAPAAPVVPAPSETPEVETPETPAVEAAQEEDVLELEDETQAAA